MLQNESEKPRQAATRAVAAVMLTSNTTAAGQVARQPEREPAKAPAVSQVVHQ